MLPEPDMSFVPRRPRKTYVAVNRPCARLHWDGALFMWLRGHGLQTRQDEGRQGLAFWIHTLRSICGRRRKLANESNECFSLRGVLCCAAPRPLQLRR